jgi:hypothetical protein
VGAGGVAVQIAALGQLARRGVKLRRGARVLRISNRAEKSPAKIGVTAAIGARAEKTIYQLANGKILKNCRKKMPATM